MGRAKPRKATKKAATKTKKTEKKSTLKTKKAEKPVVEDPEKEVQVEEQKATTKKTRKPKK